MKADRRVKMVFRDQKSFCLKYPMLKEKRFYLDTFSGSKGQTVAVDLVVPGLAGSYPITGLVTWTSEPDPQKPKGGPAWIEILDCSQPTIGELTFALRTHEQYRRLLGLPPATLHADDETRALLALEILKVANQRAVRGFAVDLILTIGAPALPYVRHLLCDERRAWFIKRNALFLLGRMGHGRPDKDLMARFLSDGNELVRKEAKKSLDLLEHGLPPLKVPFDKSLMFV